MNVQHRIRRSTALVVITAAASALSLSACGDDTAGNASGSEEGTAASVKIGLIADRSGPVALAGKSFFQGVEFGAARLNAEGDGPRIELAIKEGAGDPARSVAQQKQFTADRSIAGTICCVLSPVAGAVKRLSQTAKMPLAIYGATEEGLEEPPYVYRTATLPQPANAALAKEVAENVKPSSAVYVTTQDNAGMVSQMKAFKQVFDEAGVQSKGVINTLAAQTDFSGAATKAIAAKADLVVASALNGPNVSLIKALRNRGYEGLIIAGETISAGGTFKASGGTIAGVPFPVYFYAGTDNPAGKEFAEAYEAKYGEAADSYAAQGYIAMRFMLEGAKNAGDEVTRESLTEALGGITSIDDTLFGAVTLEKGQMQAENAIQFIQYDESGKLVPWEPGDSAS